MKFFRKEPTAQELEGRIGEARGKVEGLRTRLDELAIATLFDQAALVEVAKLREAESAAVGELEILERGLAAIRRREADAEAARLAAEKQARVEAWNASADEALREFA